MPTPTALLPRASFGDLEFPIEQVTLSCSLRKAIHEVPKLPGGQPEKNGRRLYTCRMRAIFDTEIRTYGALWPERLSQLRALFDSGATRKLTIPQLKASLPMYCGNWSQTLAWQIQSGERAEFEFEEDPEDRRPFLMFVGGAAAVHSIDTTAAILAAAAT